MIFNRVQTLDIKGTFKFYPYLVCGVDRKIYQLSHFKKVRTCYFKEIKYNEVRKGYRINSVWVSKKRLLKHIILKNETIEI